MPAIDLSNIHELLDGHVDVKWRGGAFQPIRIPAAEQPLYDPFTRWVACTPGGARLRLTTTARRISVAGTLRQFGQEGVAPRAVKVDLFVDGRLHARRAIAGGALVMPNGEVQGNETVQLVFDDLPQGEKHIELWPPQMASLFISGIELDQGVAGPWPDKRKRIVFHGSSITHCAEADGPSDSWPASAARLGDVRHLNLGWAGSCLLSGLAARIIRDQPADAIVMKLGINVWPNGMLKERTFLDSAHAMFAIIRERHAQTPVLVVSPIFSCEREDTASDEGVSLVKMRELLEEAVRTRQKMGDQHISYLSGLQLFGAEDEADLPDRLHPNAAGYIRMGERFHRLMLAPGQPWSNLSGR